MECVRLLGIEKCHMLLIVPIYFRFGSIIGGALQSKLFSKREKTGETKGALGKKKHTRGSFSFHGGMQVLKLEFPPKKPIF